MKCLHESRGGAELPVCDVGRDAAIFVAIFLFAVLLMPVQGAAAQQLPDGFDPSLSVHPALAALRGDEPAVTRLHIVQFDVESARKAVERKQYAVTIFEPRGRDRGRMVVGYDKLRRIERLKGRLRSADGRVIRELKKADIEDFSAISDISLYEDNRVRVAELYHDEFPYTVEYEVVVEYNGIISWPSWYPQGRGEGIEYGALEVSVPQGATLRHTTRGLDVEPVVKEDRKRRSMRWSVERLPAVEQEEYGPPMPEQVGAVHTAPAGFEIEGRRGDMSTWDGFGSWYADLSRGSDVLPPALVDEVRRLAGTAADDAEKVRLVYEYLQHRTRYVSVQLGIGGWKPYDALYVHERRYGDCKALTNYLIALLNAVGVPAYPALIRHGTRAAGVLEDFPSNQFNHVVVFVPLPSDTLWLEATSQTIPFGHLGAGGEDRLALVIRDSGSGLIRTPRSLASANRQERMARIVLEPDGDAVASIATAYSGNQQDRLRGPLAQASAKQRDEWLHHSLDVPQFEVLSADFAGVEARGSTIISLPLSLRLPRLATSSGSRLFLTPTLMDRWTSIPEAVAERRHAVATFAYAFLDVDTLDYVLPPGYAVEALPDPVQIQADFGMFEAMSSQLPDGTLRHVRRFEISKTSLPPHAYGEFREFLIQVARSDRAQVVIARAGS